jgi:HK97 family phage prohead protease
MKDYQSKVFNLKALDVDEKNRTVKVAIAELESIDRDNDVFEPVAFDKTIKESGPTGSNEVWHLLDHTAKSFSALSKFSELGRDGKYIAGVSKYKNSFAWREVAWPLYEAGDITQHSVGFKTIKETKAREGHNIIQEVKLFEGSAVLWGANPNTPTMQLVKSLMNMDEDRDITAAEKIDEIIKRLKDGRYEEEKQSLLIIELKRLQYHFDNKDFSMLTEQEKTTQPEAQATEPEAKSVDYGLLLNNYLTTKNFR